MAAGIGGAVVGAIGGALVGGASLGVLRGKGVVVRGALAQPARPAARAGSVRLVVQHLGCLVIVVLFAVAVVGTRDAGA